MSRRGRQDGSPGAAPAPPLPAWVLRPWRMLRKDIGRKATAFAFALLLWTVLQGLVVKDEPGIDLEVRAVAKRAEGDREHASALYLVVPDDLILRKVEPARIGLHVKGKRDDVTNLNLTVVVPFYASQLGTSDEKTFTVPLERDDFKNRGDPPQLTYFKVTPDTVTVTLARRASAEITLSQANVTLTGKPREGYAFQESRIALRPNVVTVSGPRAAIEALRADPGQPRLTPVNIDGRSTSVSQLVGLPRELTDAGVTLQTANGTVEATIIIAAEDKAVNVVSVPVLYRNPESLAARKLRIAHATPSLDLKVVGPPSELDKLSPDLLRQKIALIYDWAENKLPLGHARVAVFRTDLPDSVRIFDLATGEAPQIEYALEPVAGAP